MKLKRHKNGNQWEVANLGDLPARWWPVVFFHQEFEMYVPVLYLPGGIQRGGLAARTLRTAWARLEAMTEKEIAA